MQAKKHLGQNFLHDQEVIDAILEAAALSPKDTVLEVGPGKGALTHQLIEQAGQLIAVEYDEELLEPLTQTYGKNPKFKLIHEDALKVVPPSGPYKLVANLPYYITSPLINHFLKEQFLSPEGNPPQELVIMVQKEVAEKILAEDGRHSVLSLQVQIFGEASLVCIVPKTAFDPVPKVDSAVLHIQVNTPKIHGSLKDFFWLLHMSFAQKRKKLSNNLANAFRQSPADIKARLDKIDIDSDVRAEALNLEEWQGLFDEFKDEPR